MPNYQPYSAINYSPPTYQPSGIPGGSQPLSMIGPGRGGVRDGAMPQPTLSGLLGQPGGGTPYGGNAQMPNMPRLPRNPQRFMRRHPIGWQNRFAQFYPNLSGGGAAQIEQTLPLGEPTMQFGMY